MVAHSFITEFARQVAAGGAEGQHGSSGQILVQWFFLYWIDTESRGAAVRCEHNPVILTAAHEAQAALAFVKPAIAWADIALDTPVFEPVPVASRKTFQAQRFNHRIRRVDHWAISGCWPTGMGSCATVSGRARLLARAYVGVGSFYSRSGGDRKPNGRQSRPLWSKMLAA